jgi:APA family basic amino acid/polyamine antiporter
VVQAMAAAGQFPAIAAPVSRRTGAPVVATWLQVTWSMILLWSGSFESLLEYSSVGLALISMLTISTIYVLRWKRPELERPFRVPGYPVVPAIYLALTGLLTVAAFARKPVESSLALASILVGVPFYLLWRRRSAGEAARQGPNTATE